MNTAVRELFPNMILAGNINRVSKAGLKNMVSHGNNVWSHPHSSCDNYDLTKTVKYTAIVFVEDGKWYLATDGRYTVD